MKAKSIFIPGLKKKYKLLYSNMIEIQQQNIVQDGKSCTASNPSNIRMRATFDKQETHYKSTCMSKLQYNSSQATN